MTERIEAFFWAHPNLCAFFAGYGFVAMLIQIVWLICYMVTR